jgi:hypothetical protein
MVEDEMHLARCRFCSTKSHSAAVHPEQHSSSAEDAEQTNIKNSNVCRAAASMKLHKRAFHATDSLHHHHHNHQRLSPKFARSITVSLLLKVLQLQLQVQDQDQDH